MWGMLLAFLAKLFGIWVNKTPSATVEAEKAGAADADWATADAALGTETAVANAEADAPKSDAAVDDALSKGDA